jgi:hypothetical protein
MIIIAACICKAMAGSIAACKREETGRAVSDRAEFFLRNKIREQTQLTECAASACAWASTPTAAFSGWGAPGAPSAASSPSIAACMKGDVRRRAEKKGGPAPAALSFSPPDLNNSS